MAQTVLGSSAVAVHRQDRRSSCPDAETGADHSKDPKDCRDTAGAAHALKSRECACDSAEQKTLEVPQVHCGDRIADVFLMMPRQPSTIQSAQSQRQVPVIQKAQRIAHILVPQMVEENIAEVVKVIPREPVSERTVEQIVHVPVEISQEQVQQRTVELEHSLQHDTHEVPEKSELMKSGRDAGENPFARVNGLITDLIPDEG